MFNSVPLILFVCTGNTCRSPMAEYLFRERYAAGHGWRVGSAGTHAVDGCPASDEAVKALNEVNIDLRGHRSSQLTQALVDAADLIVVMTEGHRQNCLARFPSVSDKVRLLKHFDPKALDEDVIDPIGHALPVYRAVREEIGSALNGVESYVLGEGQDGEE
jgi:protein-tyrosine-phosphatase